MWLTYIEDVLGCKAEKANHTMPCFEGSIVYVHTNIYLLFFVYPMFTTSFPWFRSILWCVIVLFLVSGCMHQAKNTSQQTGEVIDTWMQHDEALTGIATGTNTTLSALEKSPRHQERVEIDNNGKSIHARVVYPEVSTKSPVVLVIHENKWLTDWVRLMADEIAAEGYIAIAPDLLSSFSETQKKTADFVTADEATQALYKLDPQVVLSDLQAVSTYAKKLSATNGKIASVGFCWGGSQSFRLASTPMDKSFVFYGTAPEDEQFYATVETPVIAFYGGDDERVNATIEQTTTWMKQYNKGYESLTFDGAGHAFMRRAVEDEAPSQPNKDAREKALARMLQELAELQTP
jgi:carboxymethylenebutenolidase